MTTFDNREKAFEAKYEHDQELQFKVNARRNKLLGLWAAGLLGKAGADADAYAKEVVMADFEKPGDSDVMHKLMTDLAAAGKTTDENTIRKESDRLAEMMPSKASVRRPYRGTCSIAGKSSRPTVS